MCTINKDYIGVIREKNGVLYHEDIPVNQDDILLSEIEAMKDNDNRTIIDLQDALQEKYPESIHKGKTVDYLYPLRYNDSFVSSAKYPKFVTYKEFKDEIEKYRATLNMDLFESENAKKELNAMKNISEEKYNVEVTKRKEKIENKVLDYKRAIKKSFNPKRYCFGFNYLKKKREIEKRPDIKLVTTDNIGWSDFTYDVNDDISVLMKTNYGYGSSAYMFANLTYKGVNILPYTAIVKYYYVGWTDFVRYTRKYHPMRESWDPALDFLVETINLAKQDPEKFLKVWVVDELKEMMKQLKVIFESENGNIEYYLHSKKEIDLGNYMLVRNCNMSDITQYNVLPKEKVMAFKAEKITGCLNLLENLKKLQGITPYVDQCINEIITMNMNLRPELITCLNAIRADMEQLRAKYRKVDANIQELRKQIEPYEKKIQALYEKKQAENRYSIIYLHNIQDEYKKEHADYALLCNKLKKEEDKAYELSKQITLRNNFVNQLEKCNSRIEKHIAA